MDKKWLIGVDLGGTTTKIAIVDATGHMQTKWEIPTDCSNSGKNIPASIAKSIHEYQEQLNISKDAVYGVGIGAPGPVDYETGTIRKAVNLGWNDPFPLKDLLEKELSLPVTVENDANCAALGEMWKGAGEGLKDLICVTLGTGVGGGIITNGEIVRGSNGSAGEIGHIVSVIEGGTLCNCGKHGCLETIASATGIVRVALKRLEQLSPAGELVDHYNRTGHLSAKDVFDFAKKEDSFALEVVEEISKYLGVALANMANTLNPDAIVIGGGVSKAGDLLLQSVNHFFQQFAFPPVRQSTELRLASLGNDAGVIGAARLVAVK